MSTCKWNKPVANEDNLFRKWHKLVDYFLNGLVERYGRRLMPDEAESELNFALLRAIRTYKSDHPSSASQMTWYCRCLYNAVNRRGLQILQTGHGKAWTAKEELADDPPLPDVDKEIIDLMFNPLGPKQRDIMLARMKGKNTQQIADMMGMATQTVRAIEKHVIELMKAALASKGIHNLYEAHIAGGDEIVWHDNPKEMEVASH